MRRRFRGALLLEALLGLGIFAVALLLSFGVFPNSQRATTVSRNYVLANSIARDFLDRELLKDYDSVAASGPTPVTREVVSDGVSRMLDFEHEIVVDLVDAGTADERKNVRSIVRWNEGPFQREVFYECWAAE